MPWSDDQPKQNNEKDKDIRKTNPWGAGNEEKKIFTQGKKFSNFGYQKDDFFDFFKLPNEKFYSIIALIIFGLWFASGIYQVNEGEEAVVLRFGKYVRTASTGLNYHLPSPIEKVIKEKVGLIRKEDLGDIVLKNTQGNKKLLFNQVKTVPQDNLVLTGDENILDISYVVQWKINNLKDYIFNVTGTGLTVRDVSESAMREIVGNNTLAKTYTDGRYEVELEAKKLAQETLDLYRMGVEITAIQMMKVDPPAEVIDAFREVQNAKADKEREINLALSYRNDIIPRARGQAAKIIQDAMAYKYEVVERAKGDTERFKLLYDQYKKDKNVTKKRLYLDAMQQILQGTEKIVLDSSKNNNVVSYLPLPNLGKISTPDDKK